MSALSVLLLWDIDETLLLGSQRPHFAAMRQALAEVFQRSFPDIDASGYLGRTDFAIARDVAVKHGVSPEAFTDARPALGSAWPAALLSLDVDFEQMLRPGLRDVLNEARARGWTSTLVTGNLRDIAEIKMRGAKLDDDIRVAFGAYGSDHEKREKLPPLARLRSGGGKREWPRGEAVLIGDTPRDVACAKSDQLRCIAVLNPLVDRATLDGADWIVDDAAGLMAALTDASGA
jgi:phosphoglycolate phosphatase